MTERPTVPSAGLRRDLEILDVLAGHGDERDADGFGVSWIAQRLGREKSQVSRALRALEAINDRLMSPTERLLRTVFPQSSFVVLPLFALANAGVELTGDVFAGHESLMLAFGAGLFVGKPVGFLLTALLAVRLGAAVKPQAVVYSSGFRNRFGHPRPEVRERYAAAGTVEYLSSRSGALGSRQRLRPSDPALGDENSARTIINPSARVAPTSVAARLIR